MSSIDEAREYLARVLSWPQDESSAFINTHWTFVPKDLQPGRKLPWAGRAVRNLDQAAKALAFALKSPDTRDVYACQSTQSAAQEVVTQSGWKYYKPVRLAENATALKGLWLDIDVKDTTVGYTSMKEAITSLGNFTKAAGLPKPSMLVGSGGGLHTYWLVNRPMTVAEWYPLACALVEATKQHGLKCDTQVTTDAARVLRVPGTLNHKTTPPRPVRILARTDFDYRYEKLADALEPYKVEGALPDHLQGFAPHLPRRTPLLNGSGDDDLISGIQLGMSQHEIRACLDAIPNTGQDWNFWNTIGMRVFSACDGADYGLEEWQRWSDQVKTDGKDSCEARWETLQHSPPTRTGAGALINAARDATGDPTWMPLRTMGQSLNHPAPAQASGAAPAQAAGASTSSSSPIVTGGAAHASITGSLSAPASPSTPPASDPHLPSGYTRDQAGIIWLIGLDGDGKTTRTPISDYPMTDAWLQKDPRVLHFATKVDRGRSAQIDLPLEVVGTNEMRKTLQAQGFMLKAKPMLATEFFLSWIKRLQESKDTVHSQPFGWTVNGNVEGFVYGGKEFIAGGEKQAASADPVLARQFRPTGDLQPWIEAAKLVTSQGRPQLDAVLASAFAAPLVKFTGHRGMLLSVWSQESGIGKSTALAVAQSVWGDPIKGMAALNDTYNSAMNKIGELRHLPIYWDELKTEEDTKKFVNITFSMTQGKEKSRLTQQARQREIGDWQTLLICASNDSLLDYVVQRTSTTTAGLMRVFEYEVSPGVKGQIDPAVAQRIVARLNHNYGQVGLAYAKFLGDNVKKIDREIEPFLSKLNDNLGGTKEERFWIALIGALILGAKYANDLGFTSINLPALKEFLSRALDGMRVSRQRQPVDMKVAMNVSNILASFLNSMAQRHTIRTNRIHITAGKPALGSIKILNGESMNRVDGIYVHIGVEDKLLRISSTFFTEWLKEKGYSRPIITRALEKEFGMKQVRGRIASGTQYAGATEYLLELQLAGSQLLDFISEQ